MKRGLVICPMNERCTDEGGRDQAIKLKKPTTPYDASDIITPLNKTPTVIARSERFFGRPQRAAISEPVHAPVPGMGMATKSIRAMNIARVILRGADEVLLALSVLASVAHSRGIFFSLSVLAASRVHSAGSVSWFWVSASQVHSGMTEP